MSNHAYLSPSFSKIGYACAASAQRVFITNKRIEMMKHLADKAFNVQDETTKQNVMFYANDFDEDASKAGTALHSIMEALLSEPAQIDEDDFTRAAKMFDNYEDLTQLSDDRNFIISRLVSVVHHVKDKGSDKCYYEQKNYVHGTDISGTVDIVGISEGKRHLYIGDLKTGRLEVEAKGNSQLLTYAVGTVDTMDLWDKIDTIELEILGLRFDNNNHTINVDELHDYKQSVIIPAYIAACDINPKATPGDHCRYCSARIHCEDSKEYMRDCVTEYINRDMFTDITIEELEELFAEVYNVEKLLKPIKRELNMRYAAGAKPTNVKCSGGKRETLVLEEAQTIRKLSEILDPSMITKQQLVSLSELKSLARSDPALAEVLPKLITTKKIASTLTPI